MGISSSTKTTTRTPNAQFQPYITDSMGALQSGYNTANDNVKAAMPSVEAALQKATSNLTTPPQYLTDARTQLDKTINGDMLGKNPYASSLADLISQKTGAQYASSFGKAGRANGGMAALLSGQGIGDALNQFWSNQYNTERGLQQQAMMAAPAFHADEYTDVNPILAAANASATLPMAPAQTYANTVTAASSPYVTDKTKETQAWGPLVLGAALSAAGAAAGVPGLGSMMGAGMGGAGGAMAGAGGLLAGGGGLGSLISPAMVGSGLSSVGASPFFKIGG